MSATAGASAKTTSSKQTAPRITQKPILKQFEHENRLQLLCELQANPMPSIKWYRGSIELKNSSKLSINTLDKGQNVYELTLEINDLTADDSGVYKIVAKNSLGETNATITLNFASAEDANSKENRIADGISPNFIEKPIIKSDSDGKRLCFECKIKSVPEPSVKWFYDERELSDTGRFLIYCDKLNEDTYFACLEIDDVCKSDAGKYTIYAKNTLGESTASISLNFETEDSNALGKPIFTDKPKIRHFDDRILFECHLTCDSTPEITWTLNKTQLKDAKTRLQSDATCNHIVFLELSSYKSGTYVCTAKNAHGESTCTINLQVENEKRSSLASGIFPRLVSQPKIVQTMNKTIAIDLEVEARPTPSVTWYRGETLLESFQMSRKSTDVFSINLQTDQTTSLYKCVIENELGQFIVNTNLVSKSTVDAQAPTLTQKPSVIKDDAKKTLKIECHFKARPDCSISWLKGKEPLKTGSKYNFNLKRDNDLYVASLDLSNFSDTDAGAYKCQAKNEHGQSNVLIHIDVLSDTSRPKLSSPKINREAKLISVEIECESDEKPEVKWLAPNGKQVPTSDARFFQECVALARKNVFKIILEIDEASVSDAGLYTCQVRNKNGETRVNIDIKIENSISGTLKVPIIVDKPKDQVAFDGDKVIVQCKIERASDVEMKWCKNKKPIEKSSDFEYEFNGECGKLIINDAHVDDSGDYSCVVANSVGQQVANFRINVKEKKGKLPRKRLQKKGAKPKTLLNSSELADFRSLLKHRDHEKNKKKNENYDWGDLRHVENEASTGDEVPATTQSLRKISKQEQSASKRNSLVQQNESMYETEGPKRAVKHSNGEQQGAPPNERKLSTQPFIKLDLIDEKSAARKSVAHSERKVRAPLGKHDAPLAPLFLEKPENKIIAEGGTDFIEAQIDGNPFPQVTWEKGTRTCVDGPKFQFEKNVETGVVGLMIQKAKADDESKYTLKISNEHGEEKAVFSVFVKSSKDDSADFRSLLKHRDHMKQKGERESLDWGDLKHHNNKEGDAEIEQDSNGSKTSSRRNSIALNRPHLRHVDAHDDKDNGNSLKVRRDSARRTSLVNLIPDWPTLHAVKVAAKEPEKFIKNLEDISAKEEDGHVKFECEFCKSSGKLRWYKQKAEIFHGLKYHIESEGTKHTLTINKLSVDDAGKYICNINGIETSAKLSVEPSKPKFEFLKKLPVKLDVFRTKQTLLECFVNHEDCVPKWYKGNELLMNDARYRFTKEKSGRCTLKIQNTKRDDEVVFTCKIDDEEFTSCAVYVEEPDFKFVRKLASKLEANEGKDVELECEIEDAEAECCWFFNGKMIDPRENPDKYQVLVEGLKRRLLIKNSTQKDAGKYECKCGLTLTSSEMMVKENLKVTKNLVNGEALEEASHELQVQINKLNGKPVWYRNGKMLNFSEKSTADKFSTISQEYTHMLVLKKVDLKDAGEYEVRFDKVSDKCNLTVKECDKVPKVDLTRIPKKLKIKAGREMVLEVPYDASPEPNLSWKKNGEKLASSDRLKIKKEGRVASLKIDKAKRSDSGQYELTLSNAKGETKIPIEIEILDRPSAPEGPLNVTDVTTTSAVLSWEKPADNGGAPITSYIIEKMDAVRETWSPVDTIDGSLNTIKVTKLTPLKEYQFRVRAVNSEGESPNLETVHKVLAKYPFDEPDAPSVPVISDWTNEKVDLKWVAPKNDGGAPIEKYIIERREKGKQWQKASEISGSVSEATVSNLSEGKEYEFRVIAVNKAGAGVASEPSNIHLVKHRSLKPRIDKYNLKQITIKATLTLNIEVKFVAEPLPTCEWFHNGQPLVNLDRISFEIVEKQAKVIIRECKRTDCGKYTIKLVNPSGTDTADIEVVVLAAPFRPKGPLEVKDIKKDSVTLAWSKPEDDGGRPVQSYIVQKKLKNSDIWETVSEAIADELYTIKNLKEGQEYEFRVMAENANGIGEPLVIDKPVLAKSPYTTPSAPHEPQCVNRSEAHIELAWKKPSDDGGAPIKGYVIERREKNSKKWTKLTREPLKETHFVDEKVKPRQEYEYRVYALNEEGQSEPSSVSSVIQARPLKEKPQIVKEGVQQEIKIRAGEPINLHFPIIGFPLPTISVSKADGISTGDDIKFTIDEEKLSATSPSAQRSDTGQYLIKLENSEGSDTIALKLNILDVPGKCQGPIEVVDSTKTSISLKWKPPMDDGGADITAFIIEKQLEGSEEWEKCLSCTQPQATLKGLPEGAKYTFRVRAENMFGLGEGLDTSNVIVVKPPYDPPCAPDQPQVIDSTHTSIKIHWKKPKNDGGNPISGYIVEQKRVGTDDEWTACNKSPIKSTEFNVTGLDEGQNYEFRVIALNDLGPGQPSLPTEPHKAEPSIVVPSQCGTVRVDEVSKDHVTLSWTKPADDGGSPLEGYVIEKKTQGSEWTEISQLEAKATSCSINGTEGEEAQFRIRAKNAAGLSEASKPSELVKFENQPLKPSFDLTHVKDVYVKAHEKFEVHIPYKGFPKPNADIFLNDEQFMPNDRFEIIIHDDIVSIINHDSLRSDHGHYKIVLKNSHGSAQTQFKVIVHDRPLQPTGPLEVYNMTPESCTLQWKDPQDDGGNELLNFIVEKREVGSEKWTRLRTNENICQIKGLDEGKSYEFRVAAENVNGISEFLTTQTPITAKWPFSTPTSPGEPKCLEHTETSLLVGWTKPKNDGGDVVSGYVVEKREEGSDKWTQVGQTHDTQILIKNLLNTKKYDIRVAALNRAGRSGWASTSESIEVCAPFTAPRVSVYFSGNREIITKVGEVFKLIVPYEGSPKPSVTWKQGDELCKDGNNIVNLSTAELHVSEAKPHHAGYYTCFLSNKLGEDMVTFKVIVLDRPSQVESLEVVNINADGCLLKWKPPKNDGCSQVTNYIIEKMDVKTNEWSRVSSYCRKNEYEFIDLDETHTYKFRVYAENAIGKSDAAESNAILIKNPLPIPEAPSGVCISDTREESLTLTWNSNNTKNVNYIVEMKKATSDWTQVHTLPLHDSSLVVNNLDQGVKYSFRVRAKNASGVSVPSCDEVSIILKSSMCLPEAPGKPKVKKVGRKYAELEWEPNNSKDKIIGYFIEKKLSGVSNSWTRVNTYPLQETSSLIIDLLENELYEFRVIALNKKGESEASESSGLVRITEYPDGKVPEFTLTLKDTEVPMNGEAHFYAEFNSQPGAHVKWYKNGVELFESSRYHVEASKKSSKLIIKELWENNHNNLIKCTLENPLGKVSSEATIRLKAPPKVDKEPQDQQLEIGETLRVKIPISGKGPFKLHAKINDQESDRIKIDEFDGFVSLSMTQLTRNDCGKYTIFIANDSGSTECSFRLKIRAPPSQPQGLLEPYAIRKNNCKLKWLAPLDDGGSKVTHYTIERKDLSNEHSEWIPYFDSFKDTFGHVKNLLENHEYLFRVCAVNEIGSSEALVSNDSVLMKLDFNPPAQPSDLEVRELGSNFISFAWSSNDKLNLKWTRPECDDGAPITGYHIEKREKGSDRWIRCNQTPITSNLFTITNLIEDNEYEFKVFAENEAGLSAPSNTTPFIRIRNPHALPEFTRRLLDQEAIEGSDVLFECEVQADVSRIQWLKNGIEISECDKYRMTQEGQIYRLLINNVSLNDEGDVSVRIYNQNGSKTSKASLSVKYKPKIRLPNRYHSKVTFKKLDLISIKVPFLANPRPDFTWKQNNDQIFNADYEISSYFVTLSIKNAERAHSGVYRLKLENEIGSDSCEIHVQILDHPDSPINLHAEQLSHENVKLTWQSPPNDGGSEVTNYIVEKCEYSSVRSNQVWSLYAKTHACYLSVYGLSKDQRYQFRVVAENFIGRSLPCEPLSFEFKIEQPRKKSRDEDFKTRSNKNYSIPDDYDKCFHDLWSKPPLPSPIMFKTSDVNDDYDILEEIGRGAFGVVHRAIERKTGRTFAAKFVKTPDAQSRNLVKRECEMMNQLIHPKLLNLHDYYESGPESILITEFLAGGELFNRLADKNFVMTEEEAKVYIRQLCHALRYMHENNIVHLDIKPENIMFETKTSSNLKLVDFGLAAKLDPEEEVKVTSATIEFSAPEIVAHEAVGFFTDMWSVGVLTYILLSGLSPFCGPNDDVTSENIKNSDLIFPECFASMSENSKDFIRRLLVKQKTGRMNVFDALNHAWLLDDREAPSNNLKIPHENYEPLRDRIRRKYEAFKEPLIGIGRIAQFSSLKRLKPSYYSIYSSYFDRREAAPRFISKPRNQHVLEGQTAEFKTVIVAPSQPLVSWYRDGVELKQSTKHMKRYSNNSYLLEIKKCNANDRGEYVLKASNSYGDRECVVFLTVDLLQQPILNEKIERKYEKRQVQHVEYDLWREADLKPTFTFLLRPRLIQEGIGVKFLCVVSGRPTPKVTWFKDNRQLDPNDSHYSFEYDTGVCTLDIVSCHLKDSGVYSCRAENELGSDMSTCNLVVEEGKFKERKIRRESLIVPPPPPPARPQQQNKLETSPLLVPPRLLKKLPSTLTLNEGESLTFYCSFEGSQVNTDWTKDGRVLEDDRPRTKLVLGRKETKFIIDKSTPQDSGLYEFRVSNGVGQETTKCQLEVLKRNTQSIKFGFDEHLCSNNLNEGQTLALECKAHGPEPLSVLWLRNYKEIPENPDFSRERVGNVFRLVVSEIYPEDSGVFSAVLISGASPITQISTCSIIVKAKDDEELDPKFTLFPMSQNASIASHVKFECDVRGSEPITIKWFKDEIELSELTDKKLFEIQKVSLANDGNYKVIASNLKGEVMVDFHLNVV